MNLLIPQNWNPGSMNMCKGFKGLLIFSNWPGGQSNPTFRLDARSGSYVLRRKPPGVLLKSAHAVDREFRVQNALSETNVPVARMHALCEDDDVLGASFYVMDMIDGQSFDDPQLLEVSVDQRRAIYSEMNRVLTEIHTVDLTATGLDDYGAPGNYFRRQTDRWSKQYKATETERISDMDDLMIWLDQNMPEDDGQRSLVHGDYRIDNLLFSKDGPDCLAVLDWELSTLGHPYADLAAVIMQWRMPVGEDGRGLAGVDRAKHGLPTDQEFIDEYCDRRGIAGIDDFGFYLAFCFFRMAGILQGVKKRALDGNAADPQRALRLGKYVDEFARQGLAAAKTV
jgi:aminoglycoside phosphotransferase (APT) family kinase protein